MTHSPMSRRTALRSAALAVPTLLGARTLLAQAPAAQAAPAPRAGQGEVGELFNPGVAGKPRVATVEGDNSERIKLLEQKLQCTCGCTLDIYTCRTTDFTCEYSPRLHREVLALAEQGRGDQEIIDAFVAKYGEKVLMAPKAEGFNLAGYIVPGLVIALVGMLVTWLILRRVRAAQPVPVAAGGETGPARPADAAEMERLKRALEEIDA